MPAISRPKGHKHTKGTYSKGLQHLLHKFSRVKASKGMVLRRGRRAAGGSKHRGRRGRYC